MPLVTDENLRKILSCGLVQESKKHNAGERFYPKNYVGIIYTHKPFSFIYTACSHILVLRFNNFVSVLVSHYVA